MTSFPPDCILFLNPKMQIKFFFKSTRYCCYCYIVCLVKLFAIAETTKKCLNLKKYLNLATKVRWHHSWPSPNCRIVYVNYLLALQRTRPWLATTKKVAPYPIHRSHTFPEGLHRIKPVSSSTPNSGIRLTLSFPEVLRAGCFSWNNSRFVIVIVVIAVARQLRCNIVPIRHRESSKSAMVRRLKLELTGWFVEVSSDGTVLRPPEVRSIDFWIRLHSFGQIWSKNYNRPTASEVGSLRRSRRRVIFFSFVWCLPLGVELIRPTQRLITAPTCSAYLKAFDERKVIGLMSLLFDAKFLTKDFVC